LIAELTECERLKNGDGVGAGLSAFQKFGDPGA
jgi:hypothetical protein